MDGDVNAFQRIVEKQGGNEKEAGFWSTFCALEQYSNLFDCLHDTEDEMIKLFMELGYSNSELKQLFEVGGSRASRRNWGQHATARLHRRTLDRVVEDTGAHGGEQKTKTENTFSFSADSGTAQEV